MKRNLADLSLLSFVLSVILWITLTLFESFLVGMSLRMEQAITFLVLVVPAGMGAGLAVTSLLRKEGCLWLAISGVILNGSFALFQSAILAFAG